MNDTKISPMTVHCCRFTRNLLNHSFCFCLIHFLNYFSSAWQRLFLWILIAAFTVRRTFHASYKSKIIITTWLHNEEVFASDKLLLQLLSQKRRHYFHNRFFPPSRSIWAGFIYTLTQFLCSAAKHRAAICRYFRTRVKWQERHQMHNP